NQWRITGPAGAQPVSELRILSSEQSNTYTTVEGSFEFDIYDRMTFKVGASYKEYQSDGSGYARQSNAAPAMPAGSTIGS
ncbi:hypothetical protein NL487_29390, partial [Klebsiella pneumoniae]|nr:hypothetical protein [Klebsiella pneumoniae]